MKSTSGNGADFESVNRCGFSISSLLTQVDSRVLPAPKLKMGRGEEFFPQNGRWNFKNKEFVDPKRIEKWAVVNFSTSCNINQLVDDLVRIGDSKGVQITDPMDILEESHQYLHAPPLVRVEKMFEEIQTKLLGHPQFLLCLLPVRKTCDLYGPWKKKNLCDHGIVSQCMAPDKQPNDQYLTNCLLKINAKDSSRRELVPGIWERRSLTICFICSISVTYTSQLGGMNSLLSDECTPAFPTAKVPTIILGMTVSNGSPKQSHVPSIATVVSSREWPYISRYRAFYRTQSSKSEIFESLLQKNGENDEGIIRECLLDFLNTSGGRKPEHIIIFRGGVSESQFSQVLNTELDQIREACKHLDEYWNPKFLVVVAQKSHTTKFFKTGSLDNVPPGTIIDNELICHPQTYDFYLCAHTAGPSGKTHPTHYHVLYDEIGFSPDELEELVHSLSYVNQRSTTASAFVAPVTYAHQAAVLLGKMF